MEEEQHFCLKWDNHQTNLLDGFVDLLNKEYLCDVTLACDGISLKAHKLVLATASAFFRDLFLNNPCSHPIVILPELKYTDMKALVDFIYCGQVNVSQNQLSKILKVANYLKIKGVQTKTVTDDDSYEINSPSTDIRENTTDPCSTEKPDAENSNMQVTETSLDPLESRLTESAHSESNIYCSKTYSTKPEVQIEEMDEAECGLNASYEINPSSLMEQSMTTENIMPTKSLDEKQMLANCESEYEDERSLLDLADDGNFSEVQNCHAYYNQELPYSKETHPTTMSDKTLLKLPLICSNCQYVMTTLSDAQSHLNTNPNCRTSQFQCPLCPKVFIWPATLVKHFREQHQGPGGTTRVTERLWYFCEVCRKPLLSKHALSLHRNKFHGHLVDSFQPSSPESANPAKRGRKQGTRVCRLCKRTFLSSADYQAHMQNFHSLKSVTSSESSSTFDSGHPLSVAGNESSSSQSSMSVSSVT
ncbi:myoneurin [Parasteatoda tepidariorum]|uniref:myoneurin n=1 Tax=Parasteatoda tepidariorum TaxID=114398 RepID=UPI00077F9F1F|nr:myoneurin [Parasteatoda tepidariorum]XP_042896982.1 myoneurin [Parasteatoda tepidariorum]